MQASDFVGYVAAVLTTISFVPQAWHTWKRRHAGGVSLGMLCLYALGVALWFCYGVMLNAWPVIVANALTLALALFLLAMKLRFDRRDAPPC